jgi:cAMP phosphodiesterase
MVAELSALQQIVNALTGLNGLPVVIVQCVITTIYTCESLCRSTWQLSPNTAS